MNAKMRVLFLFTIRRVIAKAAIVFTMGKKFLVIHRLRITVKTRTLYLVMTLTANAIWMQVLASTMAICLFAIFLLAIIVTTASRCLFTKPMEIATLKNLCAVTPALQTNATHLLTTIAKMRISVLFMTRTERVSMIPSKEQMNATIPVSK
jgi:hypothetical protein